MATQATQNYLMAKVNKLIQKHNIDIRSDLAYDIKLLTDEVEYDTRASCAIAIKCLDYSCETPTGGDAISPEDAYDACVNVDVWKASI